MVVSVGPLERARSLSAPSAGTDAPRVQIRPNRAGIYNRGLRAYIRLIGMALAGLLLVLPARSAFAQAVDDLPFTAEDLAKEKYFCLAPDNEPTVLNSRLVVLLGIGDGSQPVHIKQARTPQPEREDFISFSIEDGADDIIFTVKVPEATSFYLTDSTRVLKAAAVLDDSGLHTITKTDATEGYLEALRQWHLAAAALPDFQQPDTPGITVRADQFLSSQPTF